MDNSKVTEILELKGDEADAVRALQRTTDEMQKTARQAEGLKGKLSGAGGTIVSFLKTASTEGAKFGAVMQSTRALTTSGLGGAGAAAGGLLGNLTKLHPAAIAGAVAMGVLGEKSESVKGLNSTIDEATGALGELVDAVAGPVIGMISFVVSGVSKAVSFAAKGIRTIGVTTGSFLKSIFTLDWGNIGSNIDKAVQEVWAETPEIAADAGRRSAIFHLDAIQKVLLERAGKTSGLGEALRLTPPGFGKEDLATLDAVISGLEARQQSYFDWLKQHHPDQAIVFEVIGLPESLDKATDLVSRAMAQIRKDGELTRSTMVGLWNDLDDVGVRGVTSLVSGYLRAYAAAQKVTEAQGELNQAVAALGAAQATLAGTQGALKDIQAEQLSVQRSYNDEYRTLLGLSDNVRDLTQEQAKLVIDQAPARARIAELAAEQAGIEARIVTLQQQQEAALAALAPLREAAAAAEARAAEKAGQLRDAQDAILPILERQKRQHAEVADLQEVITQREAGYKDAVDETSDALEALNEQVEERARASAKTIKEAQGELKTLAREVSERAAEGAADLKTFTDEIAAEAAEIEQRQTRTVEGIRDLETALSALSQEVAANAKTENANLAGLQSAYEDMGRAIEDRQREAAKGIRAIAKELAALERVASDRQRGAAEDLRVIGEGVEGLKREIEDAQRAAAVGLRAMGDALDSLKGQVEDAQRAAADGLRSMGEALDTFKDGIAEQQRQTQEGIADAKDALDAAIRTEEAGLTRIDEKYRAQLEANEGIVDVVNAKWKAEVDGAIRAQAEADKLYRRADIENRRALLGFARQRAEAQKIVDPNQRIAAIAKINRAEQQHNNSVKDRLDALSLEAQLQKESAAIAEESRDAEKQEAEDAIKRITELVSSEKEIIQKRIDGIREEGGARIEAMERAAAIQARADEGRIRAAEAEYAAAVKVQAEREAADAARIRVAEAEYAAAQRAQAEREAADAARLQAANDAYKLAQEAEASRIRAEAETLRLKQDQLALANEEETLRKEAEAETLRVTGEALRIAKEEAAVRMEADAARLEAAQSRLTLARAAQEEESRADEKAMRIRADQLKYAQEEIATRAAADAALLTAAQDRIDLAQERADREREADEALQRGAAAALKSAQAALEAEAARNKLELDSMERRNKLYDKEVAAAQEGVARIARENELLNRQTEAARKRLSDAEAAVKAETDGVIASEKLRASGLADRIAKDTALLDTQAKAVSDRLTAAQREHDLRKSILDEEVEKALRPFEERLEFANQEVEAAQKVVDHYTTVRDASQASLEAAKETEKTYRTQAELALLVLQREEAAFKKAEERLKSIEEAGGAALKVAQAGEALEKLLKPFQGLFAGGDNSKEGGFFKNLTKAAGDAMEDIVRMVEDATGDTGVQLDKLRADATASWNNIKSDVNSGSGPFMATWGRTGKVRSSFSETVADVTGSRGHMDDLHTGIKGSFADIKQSTLSTSGDLSKTNTGIVKFFSDAKTDVVGTRGVMETLGNSLDTQYAGYKTAALQPGGPLVKTGEAIVTPFSNAKTAITGAGGIMEGLKTDINTYWGQLKQQTEAQGGSLALLTGAVTTKFLNAKDSIVTGPTSVMALLSSGLNTQWDGIRMGQVEAQGSPLRLLLQSIIDRFNGARTAITTPAPDGTGFANIGLGVKKVIDDAATPVVGGADGKGGAVGALVARIVSGFGAITPAIVGAQGTVGVLNTLGSGMSTGFARIGEDLIKPGSGKEAGGGVWAMINTIATFIRSYTAGGQGDNPDNILTYMFSNEKGFGKVLSLKMSSLFSELGDNRLKDALIRFGAWVNARLREVGEGVKAEDGGATAIGNAIADGIIAQLAKRHADLKAAGAAAASEVIAGGDGPAGADNGSPSRKSARTANWIAEGLIGTLIRRVPEAAAAGARMASAAATASVRASGAGSLPIPAVGAGIAGAGAYSLIAGKVGAGAGAADNRSFHAGQVIINEQGADNVRDQEWFRMMTTR